MGLRDEVAGADFIGARNLCVGAGLFIQTNRELIDGEYLVDILSSRKRNKPFKSLKINACLSKWGCWRPSPPFYLRGYPVKMESFAFTIVWHW
jgi:hypothetical protein